MLIHRKNKYVFGLQFLIWQNCMQNHLLTREMNIDECFYANFDNSY